MMTWHLKILSREIILQQRKTTKDSGQLLGTGVQKDNRIFLNEGKRGDSYILNQEIKIGDLSREKIREEGIRE